MCLAQVWMASSHGWMDHAICIFCAALTLNAILQPVVVTGKGVFRLVGFPLTSQFFIFFTFLTGTYNFGVKSTLTPSHSWMSLEWYSPKALNLLAYSWGVLHCWRQQKWFTRAFVPETPISSFVLFTLARNTFHVGELLFIFRLDISRKHFFLWDLFQLVVVGSSNMPTTLVHFTFFMELAYCQGSTRISILPNNLHFTALIPCLLVALLCKYALHGLGRPLKQFILQNTIFTPHTLMAIPQQTK